MNIVGNPLLVDVGEIVDSGLNSFFDNWQGAVIQLIATIILAVIIRIFFWKPITNFLDKKKLAVTSDLAEAKKANEEASEYLRQSEEDYKRTKNETADLKKKLINEANAEKERIISEARLESKRRLEQLQIDLQNEVYESQEEIKKAIKEIAFLAAEKIVEHEIDEKFHEKTVDKVIESRLK